MNNDKLYLGTTIAFPFVVSNGKLATVSGEDAVAQSVRDIIGTQLGEVFFNRYYGSEIEDVLFEMCDEVSANMIELSVAKALETWEKRINFVECVTVLTEDYAEVSVKYQILGQNELKSTAYTYYRKSNGT